MGLGDLIRSAESGGDPNAKNPNSSASGPDQFIDSTWLSTIKAARPDLAQGKSDQDLLALKTDPQLSGQMRDYYAAQNQGILSNAGLPVTPGTTYLAHFAGPKGAVGILSADPSTPAGAILGDAAVKANPFLRGMTAGDVAAWANRKMGGSSQAAPAPLAMAGPAAPQSAAPVSVPTSAPAQAAAPAQTAPAPSGGATGGIAPMAVPQPAPFSFAALRRPQINLAEYFAQRKA